jgi:hypothetical protein
VRGARLLARAPRAAPEGGRLTGIRLSGADRVVTTATGGRWSRNGGPDNAVQLWQLDSGRVQLRATARIPSARNPVVVPGRGQVAVISDSGRVRFLDDTTLMDSDPPPEFPAERVTALWNSPDGQRYAAGGWGSAVAMGADSAVLVADRPPSQWTVTDLRLVARSEAEAAANPATRPLLDLLRACLETRFGTDVGIGGTAPGIGDDEIGISGAIGGRG